MQDNKRYIQSKIKIAAPRKNKTSSPKYIKMHQKSSIKHPKKSVKFSRKRSLSVMVMMILGLTYLYKNYEFKIKKSKPLHMPNMQSNPPMDTIQP